MNEAEGAITVPLDWLGWGVIESAWRSREYLPITIGPFTGRIALREIGVEDVSLGSPYGAPARRAELMAHLEFVILPPEDAK